jgi:hypothetical protein
MIRNHADGKHDHPRNLAIVELTKTKIPAAHIQPTFRTAEDFTYYRELVGKIAGAMRTGYDATAPSCFCGSCSYRRLCPTNRHA